MMNENGKKKENLFWGLLASSIISGVLGVILFIIGVCLIADIINKDEPVFPTGGIICFTLGIGLFSLAIILFISSIIVKAGKFAYKKGKEYSYKKKLESANRYCSYCGVENDKNAKFCISCGARLTNEDKKL